MRVLAWIGGLAALAATVPKAAVVLFLMAVLGIVVLVGVGIESLIRRLAARSVRTS